MIFDVNKIEGPLREPLFILEWVVFFLFLELAFIFIFRIQTQEKQLKNLQNIAYFSFFFGFSISKVFYILGDYFAPISSRMIFYNFAYITLMIGVFFFVYTLEKYRIFLKKLFFTKIFVVIILVFIIVSLIAIDYTQTFSTMFYFFFIVFIIVYIKTIISDFYIKKKLGNFKRDFTTFCLGVFFIVVGYALATDMAAKMFSLYARLAADHLEIIGAFLLFLFFLSVPSFSEYDWQEKLDSVYIINKDGLLIYKKSYRTSQINLDQNVAAGMLTSVKMVLQELTERKGISIIEKEGKIIIIHPRELINGVIICDENLISLQILLKKFVERVEAVFYSFLQNWNGDMGTFDLIEKIATQIFY